MYITILFKKAGLHFINVLRTAFSLIDPDPKSIKKDSQIVNHFFMLLGSTSVKAARKMLMKLTAAR
jgi:hypothetical protein